MLITGSINTLTAKGADEESAVNRHHVYTQFNHPIFQAACMFSGELLCLLVFYFLSWRAKSKGQQVAATKPFNPIIFLLPALCDLTATSTMYIGLGLTTTSSFQMLRGCIVVFTSILSVTFLKRKLKPFHWFGVMLVISGTIVVGLNLFICKSGDSSSAPNPALGNLLIVLANLIAAFQMVIEEKFISGYDVPALQVVGLEGLWGLISISILLVVLYFVPSPAFLCANGNDCSHFEDAIDAFVMLGNNYKIILFTLGNIFSIAFFNFFGVSVTKHINAATRMVLDSVRTVVIWSVSLAVAWESFCYINVIGFVILLGGTVVYNGILKFKCFNYDDTVKAVKEEKAGLLSDYDREHTTYEIAPSPMIGSVQDSLYATPTLSKARTLKAGR